MDFVRSGAFTLHRRFDCLGVLGRTPPARRHVQGNGPNGADFLLKGGEPSSYPFSNCRLLPEYRDFWDFASLLASYSLALPILRRHPYIVLLTSPQSSEHRSRGACHVEHEKKTFFS